MYLQYFEPELISLSEEISKHPPLLERLSAQIDKDFYILFAEIATYLNMALAGDYSKEDILDLCGIMEKKLRKSREIHVYSESTQDVEIDMTGSE